MNWVTIVWSMIAAACLTLAAVHGVVWWWRRDAWANVLFALTAVATTFFAAGEMWMMHAVTPEQLATAMRWTHVPLFVLIVGLVGFVRLYLRAGRRWLAWTVCGGRALTLILNFSMGVNLNYRQITEVRRIPFLGESVSVAVGVPNPWLVVGQLSGLALLVFVADASLAVWRRGDRRKALLVGGSIVLFVLAALSQSILVFWGVIPGPLLISASYLGIVAAMGFELSRDLLRAAELAEELQESEQRMSLAAKAADLGLWVWDIQEDDIWSTDKGRELFGFTQTEPLSFALFTERVHPDDRTPMRTAAAAAIANGGNYYNEHRVVWGTEPVRWIAARGRVEFTADHRPLRMRGVSIDITSRKLTEAELQERRGDLAHLSRVTMLGELSGSLAHELNQPLTAILSNAQAAQRYLDLDSPNLAEVREILADIVAEDERAGEVIRRLRLLFKKGEVQQKALDANELVVDVLKVMRSDLANHGVTVETALAPGLGAICGDRVQLQQVLLNLVMNACDAMGENQPGHRRLTLRTHAPGAAGVRIEISDTGRGFSDGDSERVFERYYTTKPQGLGLGLSVCRTIISAHGGTLSAANNPERGATFVCTLGGPAAA